MDRLSSLTQHEREWQSMRALACRSLARGVASLATDLYIQQWGRKALDEQPLVRTVLLEGLQTKAVTAPGTTTDATWAGPLGGTPPSADPVLLFVQQNSLLGRVVGFRKVPFNTSVPIQTAGGTFQWRAEGVPKPVTKFAYASTIRLSIGKIHGIVALTKELVRLATTNAEATMFAALTGGLIAFQDQQLCDPAVAEVANVHPGSLTNGVTPTATVTGNLPGTVAAVLSALYTSRPGAERPTLIMSPAVAGKLAGAGTQPQLRVDGGSAFGVPVVTSVGAGLNIIAVDAAAVVYADGGLELDVSEHATVQLDDAPVADATAVPTSFWQTNLVGFRAERFCWWRAAPTAVQFAVAP